MECPNPEINLLLSHRDTTNNPSTGLSMICADLDLPKALWNDIFMGTLFNDTRRENIQA